MRSFPSAAAAGIEASSTIFARSAPIISGRRRNRSTHTPANRLNSNAGTVRHTASAAICAGVACSAMTARKLIATPPTLEPNSEMVSPVHNFMKSAW